MTPNILLLDCSYELKEKLERQGFSVSTGTIGFSNTLRQLPSQIYENEVIVYNPTNIARKTGGAFIGESDIRDVTPEYSLSHLRDHVMDRGATVLIFVNHLAEELNHGGVYDWIPFMPKIVPTKDQRIWKRRNFTGWHNPHMEMGFLDVNDVETPVRFKLKHLVKHDDSDEVLESGNPNQILEVVPLLHNQMGEALGAAFRISNGHLYVMPSFKSNDAFVVDFLNKVVPAIHGVETRRSVIDDFISPEQGEAEGNIEKMTNIRMEAEKRLETAKEELVQAKLKKVQTIREDETAVQILNYYELAQQQPDVALFFLYKVIEKLEHHYGSENEAKRRLDKGTEWNLIGRVSNASYGDVRHAPKPGEKIKQWTSEEIKGCFEAAEQVVQSYFATLFEVESAEEVAEKPANSGNASHDETDRK